MSLFSKNIHSLPRSDYGGVGKRLFLGLMCGTCFFLCLLIIILWLIPFVGLSAIHASLPYILGGISAALVLFILWLCLFFLYHIYTAKPIFGLRLLRGLIVKLIFPLMELVGRALGISREKIRLSFVKVNNEIVLDSRTHVSPEKILVLIPHCTQNAGCSHRLTYNMGNCHRCGKCSLGSVLELRDLENFQLYVATGGTIARRIVVDVRPQLIIAVACERDLTSGIQDTYPLPVFGIVNERPHGPCFNTRFDLRALQKTLQLFTQ